MLIVMSFSRRSGEKVAEGRMRALTHRDQDADLACRMIDLPLKRIRGGNNAGVALISGALIRPSDIFSHKWEKDAHANDF